MLKAVLFDVDGTLAETEEFHREAFNAVFTAQGLAHAWSVDQYRELLKVTGGKERMSAYFAAQGVALPEARIRELHLAKNAGYAQGLAAGSAQLRPGVVRLMREARAAGLRLGIATTTSEVNLAALLRPLLGADWALLFACVVAGDQVVHKKPAPDVFSPACCAWESARTRPLPSRIRPPACARPAPPALPCWLPRAATPTATTSPGRTPASPTWASPTGPGRLPWRVSPRDLSGFADLQRLLAVRGTAAHPGGEYLASH